jgi:hypothetical protein
MTEGFFLYKEIILITETLLFISVYWNWGACLIWHVSYSKHGKWRYKTSEIKLHMTGSSHTPNGGNYASLYINLICKQSLGPSLGIYQQDTWWLTQLLMYKHNHSHNFEKHLCQQTSMKHVDKKDAPTLSHCELIPLLCHFFLCWTELSRTLHKKL